MTSSQRFLIQSSPERLLLPAHEYSLAEAQEIIRKKGIFYYPPQYAPGVPRPSFEEEQRMVQDIIMANADKILHHPTQEEQREQDDLMRNLFAPETSS
jgi:hypothetical protein